MLYAQGFLAGLLVYNAFLPWQTWVSYGFFNSNLSGFISLHFPQLVFENA